MANVINMVDKRGVAAMFGIKVGTVNKWMRSADFPTPLRRGRVVRWQVSQIQAWIDAQTPGGLRRRGRPRSGSGAGV